MFPQILCAADVFLTRLQPSPMTSKCWLQSSEVLLVVSYEATRHTLIYIYIFLLLCAHMDKTELHFFTTI